MENKFLNNNVQRTVLSNGIVVISERIPQLYSITLSFLLRKGSRDEPKHLNGITHFIEHLLFKGTARRTAQQIAIESDRLGGNVDAFTSHECTGYGAQIMDNYLLDAFDLLTDLMLFPVFDSVEFERERNVVLEEMKMVEDTPDELVHEKFTEYFWKDHPLGRPIDGTAEILQTFTPKIIQKYYSKTYTPQNIIVVAAGNLRHEKILKYAEKYLGSLSPNNSTLKQTSPKASVFLKHIHKSTEQVHLILGVKCPSLISNRRFICNVLATVLGGGLSSRLFQKVREMEGLAYNIYADINAFRDAGYLMVYAALSAKNLQKTISIILREISDLTTNLISNDELDRAKNQLLTSILIGLESSSTHAMLLGQQDILFGEIISLKNILNEIAAVTADEVRELACEIFNNKNLACLTLGNISKRNMITPEMLSI